MQKHQIWKSVFSEGKKAGKASNGIAGKSKISLKEASEQSVTVVYVTSNHSETVVFTERNYDDYNRIMKDLEKTFMAVARTDDFWVDDIWVEGVSEGIDWKSFFEGGDRGFDPAKLEVFFEQDAEEIAIKMQFLTNNGWDSDSITEDTLEEVSLYEIGSERLVEGNYEVLFPEGWLGEKIEEMDLPDVIMDNWAYFEEGFARLFSDDEPNGDAKYDIIGDYFVYMYL